MIARASEVKAISKLLGRYPVVAILGVRQVGKTTLARQVARQIGGASTVFDLEDPTDLARLADPMLTLRDLRGLVVIDEVQRKPNLFTTLRVLADRPRRPARFLLSGSASPELLHQSAESLAGRIHYHVLEGFSLAEIGPARLERLWLRGGFPRSFLAPSDKQSHQWRMDFIGTFLERDLPQLGIEIPSSTLHRFWAMLAHYHGQVWNASEFGRSFGVADTTVRRYLDVLTETFVVRQLRAWRENLKKRQVVAPKIYFADSGLLHALLGIRTRGELDCHPRLGASWEGFALTEIIRHLGARSEECYFWATHAGAELDLLVVRGTTRLGFEIKRSSSPTVTPSMRSALTDLGLTRLDVIFPGNQAFPLARRIGAVGLEALGTHVTPLR